VFAEAVAPRVPELSSYKLGDLSGRWASPSSAAHRAEADAEVAAQVLIHIGRHLRSSYGIAEVDADLLVSLNKLAAAKVPQFLQKHPSRRNFRRSAARILARTAASPEAGYQTI
jgi:DNA polymerase III epsilon subunit-like protein